MLSEVALLKPVAAGTIDVHKITPGAALEQKLLVTAEQCIDFMGATGPRVLSTPQMIGRMERTCRDLALPMLETGHDTVGTRVEVSHLAAARIGDVVTFGAEILAATERRIEFRVEARTETKKIGEGRHERAIINVAKFAARLAENT